MSTFKLETATSVLATFFEHFDHFDRHREAQKAGGFNDYSQLCSVLSAKDEVHLHSRFIYSLINPSGRHYRGSAFCERFMTALGYPDFLNYSSLKVWREYRNIDLYLTDGERFVVIENKIDAADQRQQASRYIDLITAEGQTRERSVSPENILFVYLSNGRESPADFSLSPYRLETAADGRFFVDEGNRRIARYSNAHYRTNVLSWISSCMELVRDMPNVENIYAALVDYRTAVQRVTKTYTSRVMNLEDFLQQSSPELDSRTRVSHAFQIARQIESLKSKWLSNAFDDGVSEALADWIAKGLLIPITAQDCKALGPMQYEREQALDFYRRGGPRNKGLFYRVVLDEPSASQGLAVLFGSKRIHIGLFPIKVADGVVGLVDSRIDDFAIFIASQRYDFEHHPGINTVFPGQGFVSWSETLDEEIEELANFESSRTKDVIRGLVDHALKQTKGQR
jgi:hypothetical protein